MKQTTIFCDEMRIARKLVGATYKMHLAVLCMTYEKPTAIWILKNRFKDWYFSIERHNNMIKEEV